ncbi:hypothetical protein BDB01DRAFT_201673 [Pilobolus umbonatus]|nr:hypothetical protein BDB01DRAFT_201673 [Pilobolus umbonatus]
MECSCSLIDTSSIQITNAEKKLTDNNKCYIVYTIHNKQSDTRDAKRRYSEFEAFRKSLLKLYPAALIPPIPEKHSISDYARKQVDDHSITEKRKRMLERFLHRVAIHPVLSREHLFHRFMDGCNSWSDIANSATLSQIKDPPVDTAIVPSYYRLRYPDIELSDSNADRAAQHASISFEKSQKRIMRRLSELSNDYSELGSAYNALSLNETGSISHSIEKIGQVIDASSIYTKEMVKALEIDFGEHVQDYTQYVYRVQDILRYRRMKHSQLESLEETINNKKLQLRNLSRIEEESRKLMATMDNTDHSEDTPVRPIPDDHPQVEEENDLDTESIEDGFSNIIKERTEEEDMSHKPEHKRVDQYPSSASGTVLRATKNRNKKWSSPRRLLSAVTYTLQGMIDTDPEQTRRDHIDKLRGSICHAEETAIELKKEIKDMSLTIQQDFDRLQIQKEADLKRMLLSFAKIHISYCEQNMASWKDIRNDVAVTLNNMK